MISCLICNNKYKSNKGLCYHLSQTHNIAYKKYYDKYLKQPNEGICPICNKETPFIRNAYKICCSSKCTCLYKYGVEHNSQIPEVKQKMHTKEAVEKMKNTNRVKYGVDCIFQREDVIQKAKINSHTDIVNNKRKQTIQNKYNVNSILEIKEIHDKGVEASKSKEVHDKIKQTNLNKYGVTNPLQQQYVKDKLKSNETKQKRNQSIINTNMTKYDVQWPAQRAEVIDKQIETNLNKYGTKSFLETDICKNKFTEIKNNLIDNYIQNNYTPRLHLISKYGQGWLSLNIPEIIDKGIAFIDNKYIKQIEDYYYRDRTNRSNSNIEQEIYTYIRQIYTGPLKKNNRNIIYPFELDYYFPELNLAIEINGTYWHSNLFKDKDYHFNKSLLCKNKNIRLIHIYEFEWINQQDYIKSVIYNAIFEKYTFKQISNNRYEVLFNYKGITKDNIAWYNNPTIYCDFNKGYLDFLNNYTFSNPNIYYIKNNSMSTKENYQYKLFGSGYIIYNK